jgi:hypothetical protein
MEWTGGITQKNTRPFLNWVFCILLLSFQSCLVEVCSFIFGGQQRPLKRKCRIGTVTQKTKSKVKGLKG